MVQHGLSLTQMVWGLTGVKCTYFVLTLTCGTTWAFLDSDGLGVDSGLVYLLGVDINLVQHGLSLTQMVWGLIGV